MIAPLDSPFVVVVPFYNEQQHLPVLIASLRAQAEPTLPVIFVDNASTDGSRALVEQCEEVARGRWIRVQEPRVGKVQAMKTATELAVTRYGAAWIAFVDADAHFADTEWLSRCRSILKAATPELGYIHSPIRYVGIEHLPRFCRAYQAYEHVLHGVQQEVAWLANGQAFVVAVDTLQRYFAEATPTAEVDLRLSLLALSSGRRGHRNPSLVLASARRTVLDQANFDAWCFYDRAFYVGKDINSPIKANLAASRPIRDLDDGQVERFFRRRALKLVARHLMPLMLFDRSGQAIERLARTLAVELTPAALADLQPLVQARSLFSERFETLIAAIEAHEICALLTAQLDGLMRNRWGYASRSEPTAYATPR